MIDGKIARLTHSESRFGSLLDSSADFCFIAACMVKILPEFVVPLWVWIWGGGILLIKLANLIVGIIHHHKIVLPHTLANKMVGLMLFLSPAAIGLFSFSTPMVVIAIVASFAALQEGYIIIKESV